MLITSNLFYKQQLLLHLSTTNISKFYSGCLQEVMCDIAYSYYRVNYSMMTSTNNVKIITEDFWPDAIS